MLADEHSKVRYRCIDFTFDGKEKAEKIEWTEKDIDKEIAKYLQHHLKSQTMSPADVERFQIVVGGDHRDVAFQFGVSVTVEMINKQKIDFEMSCEVICRKDTAKLNELAILPKLGSNSLTPISVPAGTKNSLSEDFLLAKHKSTNIPTMMEPFSSPAAWF